MKTIITDEVMQDGQKEDISIELLLRLSTILTYPDIKEHINEIKKIRDELDDCECITDAQRMEITNKIKAKIQKEAGEALDEGGGSGAIYVATAVGKGKIGVDRCVQACIQAYERNEEAARILYAVPTEQLRDVGVRNEFEKWGAGEIYGVVRTECYPSLKNIKGEMWDLVIFDEGHNVTEGNSVFFENNYIKNLVILTATEPNDRVKMEILERLRVRTAYTLSLDQAVKLGVTAPYDIVIVTVPLDKKNKYIKAGSKDRPFFSTEEKQYKYLSSVIDNVPSQRALINRMRFIYNLRSKTEAAKWILENVIPKDSRTLIFCGSKDQADEMSPYRYYSKPSKPKTLDSIEKYERQVAEYQGDTSLTLFREEKINTLACVAALNEGHNIPNLDCGLMPQVDSEKRRLVQRMGRILRFRPGHKGLIVIICASETVDRNWVLSATAGLSDVNIRWVEIDKLISGEETLVSEV